MSIQETIKQLREAESRATPTQDGFPLTIAEGNDDDDYPIIHGKPHHWLYSLVNGNTVAYCPNEVDASLIVLMRNNLIPLLDYVEKLEKGIQETVKIGSMWATRAMDLGYDPEK